MQAVSVANPPTVADGKFLQQLALADIAGEIARLLDEAYEVQGNVKPGFSERRSHRMVADRMVAATAPSAREDALTAAKLAQRETHATLIDDARRSCDHSAALMILGALESFAGSLERLGPQYLFAAYDGSLEARR